MRAFLIAAVVSMALTVTSASATVIISDDVGGKMQDYTTHFRQVRDSVSPSSFPAHAFRPAQWCSDSSQATESALPIKRCLVSMPHGCSITPANASSARPGTQDLMNTYPAPVRAWIARQGGLTPKMMYLRGRDLATIVAPCNRSRAASVSRASASAAFVKMPKQTRLAPVLTRDGE